MSGYILSVLKKYHELLATNRIIYERETIDDLVCMLFEYYNKPFDNEDDVDDSILIAANLDELITMNNP